MINHLWQSTLFAVAAGLLAAALPNNRAQVRYWIWFSASFKFLTPFALLIGLGSHLHPTPVAGRLAAAPGFTIAPAVTIAIEQIAQPFPETKPARDWFPIASFSVWGCGLFSVALIRLRGSRRIRAAVRSSIPSDIPAAVEIRFSPGLLEPGVVGFFRPILLLPSGIEERLTPPQLESVLAHELCHVRRRDNLFAAIHMTVEAAFWFHPLVWWIGARLIEERERACDEVVLDLGADARDYAEGILNVCKIYVESPLKCVSGVTGSNLKKRIEAIMTNRIGFRLNLGRKLALAVAAAAAVAAPIFVGVIHVPAIRAQSPPSPVAVQSPAAESPRIVAQAQAQPPAAAPGGRGMAPSSAPAGISQDEYNHRLAYVQANFGSTTTPMARIYLRYGPPDSMEGHGPNVEIWRYNRLEGFNSVEFEFTPGVPMRINSPQPAIYEGVAAAPQIPILAKGLTELDRSRYAESLTAKIAAGDGQPVPAKLMGGLPSRHASMQIYPIKEYRTLSVPLDANLLSGEVDILGVIQSRSDAGGVSTGPATVRDRIQAAVGVYTANFTLDAGSYLCNVIVRELATGRMYAEAIDLEVK